MNKVTFKILTLNKKAVFTSIGHHNKGTKQYISELLSCICNCFCIPFCSHNTTILLMKNSPQVMLSIMASSYLVQPIPNHWETAN